MRFSIVLLASVVAAATAANPNHLRPRQDPAVPSDAGAGAGAGAGDGAGAGADPGAPAESGAGAGAGADGGAASSSWAGDAGATGADGAGATGKPYFDVHTPRGLSDGGCFILQPANGLAVPSPA